METIFRAASVYIVLLVLMRLAGRRTFAEMTAFDFVLILVIGEATQQALLGDDFSVTTAFLVITTLIALDVGLSYVKEYFPGFSTVIEGKPIVLVEHGRALTRRLHMTRVSQDEVLEAARRDGLERLDQIKWAILEVSGGITIIPFRPEDPRG